MKLDPEMADLVDSMTFTPETLPDPVERRNATRALFEQAVAAMPVPAGLEITNMNADGPADNKALPVRVYKPTGKGPFPVLLYFHGGGFSLGDLNSEHARCIQLAEGGKCAVVSVDYRLAPEHPYPAAFNDCYASLEWLAAKCASFGFDPKRIAVGGCSAGGALAAGVALASRDRSGPPICFQFLASPVLDDRLETPSYKSCNNVPVFASFQMERMWKTYMGKDYKGTAPVYAAPARAESLKGLPPTFILAGGLDPLRDEAVQYGARLLADGVPVEMHVIPRVPHAFDLVKPEANRTIRAVSDMQNALRVALH
jgi:acetyl esterase/lipase